MPAASATYARSRRSRSRARGRGPVQRAAGRVRWDRLGRIAMLLVLLALVLLYLDTGMRMLSTWHESRHTAARVAAMEREHVSLIREHNRLSSRANLEDQAKALGMQLPDEQTYIVGNLPSN